MNYFFKDNLSVLVNEDTFTYIKSLPESYVDLIVLDPPYFLSSGGITNRAGRKASVNKGEWDNPNRINVEYFYNNLIKECKRILKREGTLWIFGTYHNIFLAGYYLKNYDFKILNNIAWIKENPAENLSKNVLTHANETIIWARRDKKSRHFYNYKEMFAEKNKQLTDVWITPTIDRKEKDYGYHPTQKPLALIKRIIRCSAKKDSIVLDPFVGSGTTVVACRQEGIKCIGIDKEKKYLSTAKKRLIRVNDNYIDKIY